MISVNRISRREEADGFMIGRSENMDRLFTKNKNRFQWESKSASGFIGKWFWVVNEL